MRALLETLVRPLDALSPLWGLTAFSLVSGVLMLLVVGKTTNQKGLKTARDRMISAVYEVRLFMDSPGRMLKAQGRLLGWSFRYLGHLVPAFVVVAIPLSFLYPRLEIRYGLAPLPVGEATLVKVDLPPEADGKGVAAQLSQLLGDSFSKPPSADAPTAEAVRITAPPVLVEHENRLYLRVLITKPGDHVLKVPLGRFTLEKRLSADPTARMVSTERRAGITDLWAMGVEDKLAGPDAPQVVSVVHPASERPWAGLPVPWWAYWMVLATLTALVLQKPLRIAI